MTQMVFIFSLPRSGSTLLQRIISKSDDVATFAEPWILLPMICAYDGRMTYTEYGSNLSSLAIKEFVEKSLGEDAYKLELRNFLYAVYKRASQGKRYCLEKTPRYTLICEDIYQLFPDAKYIVLTRSPLAICGSILSTWAENRWKLYNYKIDIYKGLSSLVSFMKKSSTRENVLHIKYEDLVAKGTRQESMEKIENHLALELGPNSEIDLHSLQVPGQMGDKAGVAKYTMLSDESLKFPTEFLCNPIRRFWAKRYLRNIGRNNLALLGYDEAELQAGIKSCTGSFDYILSDSVRMIYGLIYDYFEPAILRDKGLALIGLRGKSNVCHR